MTWIMTWMLCSRSRNVGEITTMRPIVGLTPPRLATCTAKGQDIKRAAPHYLARTGIGFVPDDRRILAELTVWENGWVVSRSGRGILHKALN